jgi:hypothetical protein
MLEQYQDRYFKEKEELIEKHQRLEGELVTLKNMYGDVAATNNSIELQKKQLIQ